MKTVDAQVSLIDGERLVQLMIDHNFGVNTAFSYAVKMIYRDYFPEELD